MSGSGATSETAQPSTTASQNVSFLKRFEHGIAGSAAGTFAKVVLQPLDLIKTRMQVQDGI